MTPTHQARMRGWRGISGWVERAPGPSLGDGVVRGVRPAGVSQPHPLSLLLCGETRWQESSWSRTFFLPDCGVWSPWGIVGWVRGLQCAGARRLRWRQGAHRDPHSWENGFTSGRALQTSA